MNMVHIPVAAQQRRPFRVDDPRNFRVPIPVPDRGHRGQGMDDIPERARLDDQDRTDFRFQISDRRLKNAQSAI